MQVQHAVNRWAEDPPCKCKHDRLEHMADEDEGILYSLACLRCECLGYQAVPNVRYPD